MSLPVACTISGAEEPRIIEQNLEIAQNFVPMTAAEMQALATVAANMPKTDVSSCIKLQ